MTTRNVIFFIKFFMPDNRKTLGNLGEDIAASFLHGKGYKIIGRNFRTRAGEIDVICKKDGKIIFVEVKTRGSDRYGSPEEAITARKKQKLSMMAYQYLQQKKLQACNFSVDGIFIDARGDEYKIRHLENILED